MFSCTKTDSTEQSIRILDYYPLPAKKSITYRLDSTVFENLNTKRVVKTYIVQDIIDTTITDNLGKKAWRIRRLIRSHSDTTKWMDNASFVVYPSESRIDFQENNLRFIKFVQPVSTLTTWKGNSQINVLDDFLRFYENWDYTYDKIGEPFTLNNRTFNESITINHIDRIEGNPADPKSFYEKTKSYEVYAKGVGLVYKEFIHEFWQPTTANFQSNSYGIRLTYLSHNF